jgi:hypothetical protein
MKSVGIDSQFRRVPIDGSRVPEVVTGNKVGGKELLLKWRELVRLMPREHASSNPD